MNNSILGTRYEFQKFDYRSPAQIVLTIWVGDERFNTVVPYSITDQYDMQKFAYEFIERTLYKMQKKMRCRVGELCRI